MANRYWLITNRRVVGDGFAYSEARKPSYWVSSTTRRLDRFEAWEKRSEAAFRRELIEATDEFPRIDDPAEHERQKHVTLFVHGFNNSWEDAARRYQQICATLFSGPRGLGHCVLFGWPSDGLRTGYYPDRADARRSADDLADVLTLLYDHCRRNQELAMERGEPTCRAKISIIAHSMGAYLIQKAMHHAWTRRNQPLLISLVNQLLLVAADVDNDLFKGGEEIDRSEGDAIANLTYRVTAFYTGLDSTLGVSAGLKHFGKRRLGRSGLDRESPVPDNVWDIDCTSFLKGADNTHSAYFEVTKARQLMREVLIGTDRRVLADRFNLNGGGSS